MNVFFVSNCCFAGRLLPSVGGDGDDSTQDRRNRYMGPSWPDQPQRRGPLFIESSKWHRLAWSRNADGRDTLFLDDMKSAPVPGGPSMHNDFQALRKLGNCRPPEIAIDNGIYLDDLAITSQNM